MSDGIEDQGSKKREDHAERTTILWSLGVSFAVALIAMVTYGSIVAHTGAVWQGSSVPWWGALGDSLAPISGLLSALALGAAVASVFVQTRELAAQREEMRESRVAQQAIAKEQRAGA
jgi:uncharacterized membrane protein